MPAHWLGANTAHPFHPTLANLADLSCEEALYENANLHCFMGIDLERESVPDSTTITKFRKLLHESKLGEALFTKVSQELQARGVKANIIIGAPISTKNADKALDFKMHQTRKGQQWRFGMKPHIGVDIRSSLAHSAVVTAANLRTVALAAVSMRRSAPNSPQDCKNGAVFDLALSKLHRHTIARAS